MDLGAVPLGVACSATAPLLEVRCGRTTGPRPHAPLPSGVMTRPGYPRAQKAPALSPAYERDKADADERSARAPLQAAPSGRKVYRLQARTAGEALSEQIAGLLDDEQRAAVEGATGRTLILASAGAGKTRTIVAVIAHLVNRGTQPSGVCLVTFTRRAAREMTARARELSGSRLTGMYAGTFHSICQRLLRAHGTHIGVRLPMTILDKEDQADLMTGSRDAVLAKASLRRSLPKPSALADLDGLAREMGRPLADLAIDRNPRLVDRFDELTEISAEYERRKLAMAALDYADLLVKGRQLLEERPEVTNGIGWVLVDELHDVSPLQGELVELVAGATGRVVAVGDPDQAIYGWRGADPEVVDRFARTPGTDIFPLQTNYRSRPEIVSLAQAVLPAGNPYGKRLRAVRPSVGVAPVVAHLTDAGEEAAFVVQRIADLMNDGREPGEIGVLYRAHHHSTELQLALTAAGVEFELYSGSRFVESAHVKDALAFCRIAHNIRDELAWQRALGLFARVGPAAQERALCRIREGHDIDSALLAIPRGEAEGSPLAYAGENLAAVVRSGRPDEIVLGMARSEWYRDHLEQRYPNRADRESDLARLAEIAARAEHLEAFLSDVQLAERIEADEDVSGPAKRVALSSVHQAKGLEWPVVFVLQVEAGSFPSSWALSEGDLAEEERLFYVAVTRACDELYLCRPIAAKRPWDTGANAIVINSGLGFLDRADLAGLVEEWSVR